MSDTTVHPVVLDVPTDLARIVAMAMMRPEDPELERLAPTPDEPVEEREQ